MVPNYLCRVLIRKEGIKNQVIVIDRVVMKGILLRGKLLTRAILIISFTRMSHIRDCYLKINERAEVLICLRKEVNYTLNYKLQL